MSEMTENSGDLGITAYQPGWTNSRGLHGARDPKHVKNSYVGTLHTKFSGPPLNGRKRAVAP